MLKTTATEITADIKDIFAKLGAGDSLDVENGLAVKAPATGEPIAAIAQDDAMSVDKRILWAERAQGKWDRVPRAERGEFLNFLSEKVKENAAEFSRLVTYEGGKKPAGANGEVSRAWGILAKTVADDAALPALPEALKHLHRERNSTPAGVVGVITSYNFPIAVASWNIGPALLAGNSVVWKPSEKTPLTALAYKGVFDKAVAAFNEKKGAQIVPPDLLQVVVGERDVGQALVEHQKIDLISATGSTTMGQGIRDSWAKKKNNSLQPILELGGNNAIVVSKNCDPETIEVALNAIINSVMQSGGQFCTNTRRLIIHEDVYDIVIHKLKDKFQAYAASGKISNPLLGDVAGDGQAYAPLIDEVAYQKMLASLSQAGKEGGVMVFGQRVLEKDHPSAYYVEPALVEMPDGAAFKRDGIMHKETFAPVLFAAKYSGDIENALHMVNAPANARLVNALYSQSAEEIETFKQEVQSGDVVINSEIGTVGPMRSNMGFGGSEDSGQGVVLDSSNPTGPFTRKTRRAVRNTNVHIK